MGEEKPDEELMGKRKSSPRFVYDTVDVDTTRITSKQVNIHEGKNF